MKTVSSQYLTPFFIFLFFTCHLQAFQSNSSFDPKIHLDQVDGYIHHISETDNRVMITFAQKGVLKSNVMCCKDSPEDIRQSYPNKNLIFLPLATREKIEEGIIPEFSGVDGYILRISPSDDRYKIVFAEDGEITKGGACCFNNLKEARQAYPQKNLASLSRDIELNNINIAISKPALKISPEMKNMVKEGLGSMRLSDSESIGIISSPLKQSAISSFGADGQYVILNSIGEYKAEGISDEMREKLDEYLKEKKLIISDIEFTPTGEGWTILAGKENWTRNIGGEYYNILGELKEKGETVVEVEFYPKNWNEKKAFTIITASGKVQTYGIDKALVHSDSKKVTNAIYRFSYDWLVAFKVDDGWGENELEISGYASVVPYVEMQNGYMYTSDLDADWSGFSGYRYETVEVGNMSEYEHRDIAKHEGINLKVKDLIFDINAQDYGFESIEEFEKHVFLRLTCSMLDYDTMSLDWFSTGERKIYFSEAVYEPLTVGGIIDSQNDIKKNIIKIEQDGSELGISFSFEKIE